jgi:hypothetical protein
MLLEMHGLEMRLKPLEVVLAELAKQKVLHQYALEDRQERKNSAIGT